MISRCGEVRVPHWAHKGRLKCDQWWENETEWHRNWKNQFPYESQEVVHFAESGERHIADVKTEAGWVLEFQHSYLNPEERRSREVFYEQLIWIVDGNRRAKDKKRFFEVLDHQIFSNAHPEVKRTYPEGALFRDWISSQAHVLFDFAEEQLWWLLPDSDENFAFLIPVDREKFIAMHRMIHLASSAGWGALAAYYRKVLSSRHTHSNQPSPAGGQFEILRPIQGRRLRL